MQGLAHDRGLFVPDRLPTVSTTELESWRCLSYAELAVNVIAKFVGDDQVPLPNLRDIVTRSCAAFRDAQVTPLVHVGGHYVLVRTPSVTESLGSFSCRRFFLERLSHH